MTLETTNPYYTRHLSIAARCEDRDLRPVAEAISIEARNRKPRIDNVYTIYAPAKVMGVESSDDQVIVRASVDLVKMFADRPRNRLDFLQLKLLEFHEGAV